MEKERLKYFLKLFLEKFRKNIFLCICILLFICVLFIEDAFILRGPRIVFCDVGQGDGIFINAGDAQIVIDGGPDNKFIGCVGKNMPYFDHKIEYIIISHPDSDHFIGAIEILERYDVGRVYVNGDTSGIQEHKEFLRFAGEKTAVADSESDFMAGGAKIDFISLGKYKESNDNSLVFKLAYNGKSILFMGDAPIEAEKDLIAAGADLEADILKVGHHGSKTSTSEEFLRAVNPNLAIVSVGAGNKYGHPSYRVIKNLENLGIKYRRTDEEGDIVIRF